MSQGVHWILTIPHAHFTPYLPPNVACIRGQLELGTSNTTEPSDDTEEPGGYLHWQLVVAFKRKVRLGGVRECFGPWHAELTRSGAANAYVWKDDTAVAGTRFELGGLRIRRGPDTDWESIRELARTGRLDDIPADIYVRNYNSLKRIAMDHLQPTPTERTVRVYWGPTGVGKSRRAWAEAGMDAFPKDPRTKFWDGYRGHKKVVFDEFRGDIDIAHILRWFDRYPVIIEVKGSSTVFEATDVWITTNLDPVEWYPMVDGLTKDALYRRLIICHMTEPWVPEEVILE